MMEELEVLDILKQMANRLCLAAYIIQETPQDHQIRNCLATLIEDNHEDSQSLCENYCAVPEQPA